jgi:phage repressor protein C with HTH and peptisase S24 domain
MSAVNNAGASGHEPPRDPGPEKSAFVERLKTILRHWPSADRLARAAGVSPSAFRKWLRGEAEPSRERLVALARATGVGIAWLAGGEGAEPAFEPAADDRRRTGGRESTEEADRNQFVTLPAPPGSADSEAARAFIALRQDWVRTVLGVEPSQLLLETMADEAMSPTIRDGNALLIDTTDRTMRNSGIYLMEIDGHRLVRRVQRKHDGSLVLISDNSAYQPDLVDQAATRDLTVVGRIVWTGGSV